MKIKYLLFKLLIILAFTATKTFAQAPQQFNYQGAARNANGTPLSNRQISLRISILDGSATGSAQYVETRTVTTNQLGLYNFAIGSAGALSTSGTIAGVKWADGLKYIKVEIDPNNGSAFTLAGTAQLLSVPYALYAGNSSGSAASTILNGNGAPSTTTGKDGDFYIDNVANMIFGPKASGSWPAGKNIVGPKGDKGDAGVDGAKGDTGIKGDKGDKGDAGQGGVTNAGSDIDVSGSGVVADPYIISSKITGANGLTKTGSNIELGGSVTKNTTLAIDAGKTLAITGLTTGGSSDNLVVVDGSGVVKSVAQSSLVSAANGVNKDAITGNIELGGSLTKPTTITADNTNTLAVKGLQTGATTDSVMVVNPSTGIVSRVAPVAGANGLTKTGNNIELGGSVTKNTTLAIDAGKTLAITGLTTGGSSDNLVVVDGSGVVKSVAQSSLVSAANGVNKDAITGNIELGGSLTKPTTITADNTNTLAVKGLQTGATTDSVMVVNPSTGIVSRVAPVAGANGLTKTGNNIELGGSVTKNTTLAIDAGKTLAITGLTTGGSSDNLVVVDGSGVVKSVAQSSLVSAANGVNKDAVTGNIELGGPLTKATSITTDAANTLSITGLQTGASNHNIMVVDPSGVVKSVAPSTADNGLTKTGNNFQLGGALTGPTAITTDVTKTLAITGLQSGNTNDKVVVVDGTTGVVKSVAQTSLVSGVNAVNGVNKNAVTGNIELGGSLTKATSITTDAANTLSLTGLQTGSTNDKVVVVDGTTGVVKSVAQTSLVSAANGVNKDAITGNIELGGSLTKPTTITADNTNTLSLTGLQTGNTNDKVVVVDGTTGVVKSVAQTSLVSAVNGVSKDAITGNIELGGSLTKATSITTDATKTLALNGLQTGNTNDKVVVVDGTTGVVKSVAQTSLVSAANGVSKDAITGNIELGGSLTKATSITTDATKTLALNGLQTGNTNDKVVVVDGTTGVVKSVAQTSLVSAANGVSKDAITGNIELGGSLTKATSITTDATKTLALNGLQTGNTNDKVVVVDGTTGVVKSVAQTSLVSAANGVNKDAVTGNIELGGPLTKATSITTDAANTLSITGLQTGASNHNIMVVDPSGVVKSVAPSTADNGLTKTGNNFQLGGALTGPTAITTDATKTLAITGLQSGNTNDKVVVVDGTTGVVKSVAQTSLVSAANGVNKDAITGNIELGGSLTKPTTITADNTNTLSLTGLQTGNTNDKVVVVDGTTGVVKSVAQTSLVSAANGVNKDAVTGNIELGGSLTKATSITTDATKTLALNGLQTGNTNDKVVVVDGTTGVVKSVAQTSLVSAANGVNKDAITGNIELGGSLTKPTTITADNTNTLSLTGLQTGNTNDKVVVVDGTTGVVKSVAQTSLVSAANGVNKDAVTGNIELGGSLTKATSITTDATKTLALNGLQTGNTNDKVVVVDGTTGVVKSVAQTSLVSAANGVNKDAVTGNIELGGPLTKATSITTDATKTLALNGLQTGNTNDKVVVVDGTTGVVKSVAQTSLVSAANGVNKDAITGNIELGGSLTKATSITTDAANTLSITGLQTGASNHNIMVVDPSGVVKSLAPSTANNGLTRTGNNFQLGGALTGPTMITTDATKTLAISGLQTGSGLENIMVVDASGVVKSLAPSTVTANSWSLSGNAATNPATQFLGTTDAQPLVLRANNVEQMRINTAGNVGIGTTTPNTKLEVSSGSAGNSGFRLTNLTSALTTSTPNAATLGVNATGDLVVMSTAVSSAARNIINMPSVAIDISAAGNFTLDLYNAYKTQYNTPLVVSTGAPAAIPTIAAATDFYYYVTYYDTNVFSNVSINAAGVLSYTVTTNAVSSATFMNIVLVPKN